MFAVIKMELSGKTVYGPVLKTTQLSAHVQNHASPERCRKSFTMIFLGDHDITLTGSNFGNLIAMPECSNDKRAILHPSIRIARLSLLFY